MTKLLLNTVVLTLSLSPLNVFAENFENKKEAFIAANENRIYEGKNPFTGSPCGLVIKKWDRLGFQVFYSFEKVPFSANSLELNAHAISWNSFYQQTESAFLHSTGGSWSRDCRYSSPSCILVQYYINFHSNLTIKSFEYAEDSDLIHECRFN